LALWEADEPNRSGYRGPADEVVASIEEYLHKKDHNPTPEEWEHLLDLSQQAIEIDPRCHTAFVVIGTYHFERREYDLMEANFIKALDVVDDPDNMYTGNWPRWMMVTLYDGMSAQEGQVNDEIVERVVEKQFEAYLRYRRRLLQEEPSFNNLKPIVKVLSKNGMKDEAVKEIDQYLAHHPEDKKAARYKSKL